MYKRKKNYQLHKGRRAAIYIRVADSECTDTANFGQNTVMQDEKIRSYCTTKDYKLDSDHIFADRSNGTEMPEERRGLGKLLAAAKRGEFDFLVVARIERLARNTKVLLQIINEFKTCGVTIQSATEPINTGDTNFRLLLNTLASIGEAEKRALAERRHLSVRTSCQSWQEVTDTHEGPTND